MADKSAPPGALRLQWIYGYGGHGRRDNLHFNAAKEAVYFAAGACIVYNAKEHLQRFFLGHDDDVLSLSMHPAKTLCASGQIGKDPYVCVWDTHTMETVSIVRDKAMTHGVSALAFSADGTRLATIGCDTDHTLIVWDWKKGTKIAVNKGGQANIFGVAFNPVDSSRLVTCGIRHVKFWRFSGNTLDKKAGVFGSKAEQHDALSLVHSADGTSLYTGMGNGLVYKWQDNKVVSTVVAHGKSPVQALCYHTNGSDDEATTTFVSGASDGSVRLWDSDFAEVLDTVEVAKQMDDALDVCVRSVSLSGKRNRVLLVGTQGGDVLECQLTGTRLARVLVRGHAKGELWGLAVHATKAAFATTSDDGTLRLWNYDKNELSRVTRLPPKCAGRSVALFHNHIAVGLNTGAFAVYAAKDLKLLKTVKDRKEVRHTMQYSPNGKMLAVGSNDNYLDIYDVDNDYKHLSTCSGSASYITHVDWSEDSAFVQLNTGDYERAVFHISGTSAKRVTRKEKLKDVKWHSWTSVLGDCVAGIWPKYSQKNDVNAVAVNGDTIATGDDFGKVKLFRFPSECKGARFREYAGHSAHVTNVCWSADGAVLFSIGGGDNACFQWEFLRDGKRPVARTIGAPAGSATAAAVVAAPITPTASLAENVDEESDSDVSDVDGVDSDLEAEQTVDYSRPERKRVPPASMSDASKSGDAPAPKEGLSLEWAFGYRGYDCRDNVHLVGDKGELIVTHVAAVGIVFDSAAGTQRHYVGHSDDILCLAVHPDGEHVATGQVGREAEVHVWNVKNLATVSVLKGGMLRGVNNLCFGGGPKAPHLAVVALDNDHTLSVWAWTKGQRLAESKSSKDSVFAVEFNPLENTLVSCGVKHIRFWTVAGAGLSGKRGTFGTVGPMDTMLCCAFDATTGDAFTGGSKGSVYRWKGNVLKTIIQCHTGPVNVVMARLNADQTATENFVTAGKDGRVRVWDTRFRPLADHTIARDFGRKPGALRALGYSSLSSRMVVGTIDGDLIDVSSPEHPLVLSHGHGAGQLWGLAVFPDEPLAATVSDDCTLRVWNCLTHTQVAYKRLSGPARAVAVSPNASVIVVGYRTGRVDVFDRDTLDEVVHFHHRKENIADLSFSPSGKYLAVASNDNFVDLYNALEHKRVAVCKGASSYITHVDWSTDGRLVRLNSGAREELYYEAPRGKRVTLLKEEALATDWATLTCVLGGNMTGVWPPASDVTDVNAACVSHNGSVVATGDDFGLVKLFAYPATGKHARFKKYAGHSAHVTNVRFCHDDSVLVSTGGADTAVLVWRNLAVKRKEKGQKKKKTMVKQKKRKGAEEEEEEDEEEDGEESEDDEKDMSDDEDKVPRGVIVPLESAGAGDSDESDTDSDEDGYDSDVDRERRLDYLVHTYAKPKRANLTGAKGEGEEGEERGRSRSRESSSAHPLVQPRPPSKPKSASASGASSARSRSRSHSPSRSATNKASSSSLSSSSGAGTPSNLHLDYVFGYRGYDTRQNLWYAGKSASLVVSHAAAVAVVLDRRDNTQRFYTAHTDDILCMTMHPEGRLVATGQIHGEVPSAHVWDLRTMETRSILSGVHQVGVCALRFSNGDGKRLLSLGADAGHSVAVYRWSTGEVVASTEHGGARRLFCAEWRRGSSTAFVTCGVKHVAFWSIAGSQLVRRKAVLPRSRRMATMLSIGFGSGDDMTYTGSVGGDIFVWKGRALERVVEGAHRGPIFAMMTSREDGKVVTGGKDGQVKVWGETLERSRGLALGDGQCVRSVDMVKREGRRTVLVGTRAGDILEADVGKSEVKLVIDTHGEGYLAGLAAHPMRPLVATASEDKTLCVWNVRERTLVDKLELEHGACSCGFSPEQGSVLACGLTNGGFIVRSTAHLSEGIVARRDRSGAIHSIVFSPDGTLLAVGSADGVIDFYSVDKKYARVGSIKGLQGGVTNIDWSSDSRMVQANCGEEKRQVWTVPKGVPVTDESEVTWSAWTGVLGKPVAGVWEDETVTGDINCTALDPTAKTLATCSDDGLIHLYRFPASDATALIGTYVGHSDEVSRVVWTADGRYLVSTGGLDTSVFIWRAESTD